MDFLQVAKERKSHRSFTEEKLDQETIDKLLELAILSPTAMNSQSRTYTVIQDEKILRDLEEVMGKELGRENYKFMGAPCLILVSNPEDIGLRGVQDSSIALTALYYAATYYGLGACWINQFKECQSKEYREILTGLEIPREHVVYAGMVVGYPASQPPAKVKSEPVKYFL